MTVTPDIKNLIADAPLSAHVATAVDNRPHVAPVWYCYEDDVVSFVTGGRKLANIRGNPHVAVSIERAYPDAVHWTVTLLGTAEVFDDEARIERFDERAFEKYWEPTDPGEPTGDERYVEVTVGSATVETY